MKMLAVLPLFIVVLCAMECFEAAAPEFEPGEGLADLKEQEQDQEVTNNNLAGDAPKDELVQGADFTFEEEQELEPRYVSQGACPSGWYQFQAYCYQPLGYLVPYEQAKWFCVRKGGALVKINSFEENEFVLQLVRTITPTLDQIWIGLEWHSDQFYWNDLSVPVYTNWAPGEPNGAGSEPCGSMYTFHLTVSDLPDKANGYWNDLTCEIPSEINNGIVCKRLA